MLNGNDEPLIAVVHSDGGQAKRNGRKAARLPFHHQKAFTAGAQEDDHEGIEKATGLLEGDRDRLGNFNVEVARLAPEGGHVMPNVGALGILLHYLFLCLENTLGHPSIWGESRSELKRDGSSRFLKGGKVAEDMWGVDVFDGT